MSITATISPPALCLSRNQIPLRLSAPGAFTTAALLGIYTEVWGTPDVNGDTIQYTWTYAGVDYDVTFTTAAASNTATKAVQTYTGGVSIPAFRTWLSDVLIPALLADPDINQYFNIALYVDDDFSGIRLYAREPYAANLTFSGTPTGFITIENYTEGAAPVAALNYAARIFVSIAPTAVSTINEFIRLPEIQGYPNEDGHINLDLQPLIEPYFRDTDLPALPTASEIELLTSGPRKIRIEYAQQSGDPIARTPFAAINTVSVLQGGVATHDWVGIRASLTNFLNTGGIKFLTNRKRQRIYPGQPQYLHWHQLLTPPVGLKHIRGFQSAASVGNSLYTAGDTPVAGRTHRIPVGIDAYSGMPVADVIEYSWYLGTNDDALITPLSEVITFINQPRPTALTIIEYQNQWGVAETIALPWERQRVAAVAKDFYEQSRTLNYALTDRTRRSLAEQLTDTFDISIDSNDLIDGPHIPEILLSPDTYLIINGTTRIACQIEAGSVNLENHSRRGQQFPGQSLRITLDRQVSYSRILNLTQLCV